MRKSVLAIVASLFVGACGTESNQSSMTANEDRPLLGVEVEVAGIFTMLPDHQGGWDYTLTTGDESLSLVTDDEAVEKQMRSLGQSVPVKVTGLKFQSQIRVLSIEVDASTYLGMVTILPDHVGGMDYSLQTENGSFTLIPINTEVANKLKSLHLQNAEIKAFTRSGEEATLFVVDAK